MNSAPFLSLLAVLCLGASSNLSFAQTYRSHPPMRPLPQPVKAPLAVGSNLFVDAARGNDTGAGSQAAPWKSLAHATRQLQPGDTLYLRGGMYYEKVSLTRSGTTNALDLRVALGECIRHFGGEVVHIGRAIGGGGPGEQFRSELVGGCRGEHLLRGAEQRRNAPCRGRHRAEGQARWRWWRPSVRGCQSRPCAGVGWRGGSFPSRRGRAR